MSTLAYLREHGWGIHIYCSPDIGGYCSGHISPSWDQLIQYFGVDFDLYEERARFLARFVCERCGRHCATLRLAAPLGGKNGGISDVRLVGPTTLPSEKVRAAAQAELALEADRQRYRMQQVAEFTTQRKARERIEKLAEKGVFVIGPPDPRKYRKGPKPPMKG
jgi:hypothetical protein